MKIRCGFVSNSSSSSFCVLGVVFKDGGTIIDELALKLNLVDKNNDSFDALYNLSERVKEALLTRFDLDMYDGLTAIGDGGVVIGMDVNVLDAKHSIAWSKKRILNKFKELGVDVAENSIGFQADAGWE